MGSDMLTVPEMDQTEFTFEFTEENPNWSSREQYNLVFVRAMINYMHDKAHARTTTPLFLNEVLDAFGFDRFRAGQVLGWAPGNDPRIELLTTPTKLVIRMVVDGVVLHHLPSA